MKLLLSLSVCLLLLSVGCSDSSTSPNTADATSTAEDTATSADDSATNDLDVDGVDASTPAQPGADTAPTPATDSNTRADEVSVPEPDGADGSVPTPTEDPGDPGSMEVSASSMEVSLASDSGAVALTLSVYTPEGPGPFPVAIFHHGFQLATGDYHSYGEHLASWGYLTILPQTPGGLFDAPNHVELKDYLKALIDWLEVTDDPAFADKVDMDRLGLAGHSMGGKISLFLATEDARPLAVVGVDPVDAAGGPIPMPEEEYPSVTPELMDQITIPIALLGETTNGTCEGAFCQACAPEEDNFHQYYVHATGPALEVDLIGAFHMSFLDDPDCGLTCAFCTQGTASDAEVRRLTRRYLTAFFQVFVQGEDNYRDYLTGASMAADVSEGWVTSVTKNGL